MMRAFEIKLERYEHQGRQYRARTGGIKLPSDLAPAVEAVLGLGRPAAGQTPFSGARRRIVPRAVAGYFLYASPDCRAVSVSD